MSEPTPESSFHVQVGPELEAGTYANLLTIWHTHYEFTLDFSVSQPAQATDPDDPDKGITIPCSVVARVKIPPALVFDVLRAINENMTQYEKVFGEIKRPDTEATP